MGIYLISEVDLGHEQETQGDEEETEREAGKVFDNILGCHNVDWVKREYNIIKWY